MILLDANLLLYAYDTSSPFHEGAKVWLEETLGTEEEVGVSLVSLLAFLRVGTSPMVFARPMTVEQAIEIVVEWLARPNVGILQPTRRHFEVLGDLARRGKARGSALTDAHAAALALEHGATLFSSDRDFARFPGVRVEDPLAV